MHLACCSCVFFPCPACLLLAAAIAKQKAAASLSEHLSLSRSLFPLLLLELMQYHFTDWVVGTGARGGFAARGMLGHAVPPRFAARARSRVQALEPGSAVAKRQSACRPASTPAQAISVAAIAHFTGSDVAAFGTGDGLLNTTLVFCPKMCNQTQGSPAPNRWYSYSS